MRALVRHAFRTQHGSQVTDVTFLLFKVDPSRRRLLGSPKFILQRFTGALLLAELPALFSNLLTGLGELRPCFGGDEGKKCYASAITFFS